MDCIALVNRIDEKLSEMNINRAKMIRECELSESCMRAWRRGVVPNVEFVYRVAKFLGVTVEYLLTGIEKSDIVAETPVKFITSPAAPELPKEEKELLDHYRKITPQNRYLLLMMSRQLDADVTNNVTKRDIKTE